MGRGKAKERKREILREGERKIEMSEKKDRNE